MKTIILGFVIWISAFFVAAVGSNQIAGYVVIVGFVIMIGGAFMRGRRIAQREYLQGIENADNSEWEPSDKLKGIKNQKNHD